MMIKDREKPKKFIRTNYDALRVHGTISLAIALTLPYYLADHHSFQYRNDLLFIASGMVIISLVIAQVLLPLVTPDKPKVKVGNMTFKEARVYILEHVMIT